MKKSGGYSLIEIMVVLTLFALLILVSTQTLIISLRNTGKSEAIGKVKENLDLAINVMERQLRNAKSIVTCPNASPLRIDYLDAAGVATFFSCTVGTNGSVASGSARLTGSNISITSCSLSCIRQSGVPDAVTISLSAEDKSTVSGAERAKASNQTTVLLRQY